MIHIIDIDTRLQDRVSMYEKDAKSTWKNWRTFWLDDYSGFIDYQRTYIRNNVNWSEFKAAAHELEVIVWKDRIKANDCIREVKPVHAYKLTIHDRLCIYLPLVPKRRNIIFHAPNSK